MSSTKAATLIRSRAVAELYREKFGVLYDTLGKARYPVVRKLAPRAAQAQARNDSAGGISHRRAYASLMGIHLAVVDRMWKRVISAILS